MEKKEKKRVLPRGEKGRARVLGRNMNERAEGKRNISNWKRGIGPGKGLQKGGSPERKKEEENSKGG